jgi:sulfate-transporting ATPase
LHPAYTFNGTVRLRLKRYDQLVAQDVDVGEDDLEIGIPPGPRLGQVVVAAKNMSKAYGELILMDNATFDLPRGGIVGVIGANGAGKTTLFKMITGQETPTSGELQIGSSVVASHVDQSRAGLNSENTVYEEISGGEDTIDLGNKKINSRAYCSRFNFKRGDQQQKVGNMSGGERNRVHLAKLLKSGGNLLLLDEPSNDLDVNTLRSLEEALLNFGGCAVVISHDRWFLDRIATHILAFEGDSVVTWFEGNYQEYHEHRRKLLGDAADRPHRIKFKSLLSNP